MKTACIAEEDFWRLQTFSDVVYDETSIVSQDFMLKLIKNVDGCITGWGTGAFNPGMLNLAPQLKIISHTAGSIKVMLKNVRDEIKKRDIIVTNATVSLGMGVAEFALGLMLMTMKRAWWLRELVTKGKWKVEEEIRKTCEPYGAVVGVIGASKVGRHFIKLLKNFELKKILVYDPYLTEADADNLGVEKVGLEELMSRSDVVSVHAPSTEQTKNMLNKTNLKLLKDGAVVINTARGAIVNEQDLTDELKTGRIIACLDVTEPEPPKPDSLLRTLPNVILTPHIAGAVHQNRLRNGKHIVDDLERFFVKHEKLLYQVNLDLWDQLA